MMSVKNTDSMPSMNYAEYIKRFLYKHDKTCKNTWISKNDTSRINLKHNKYVN